MLALNACFGHDDMPLPSHHLPRHTSFKGRPILTPHAHTLIESLWGDSMVASRCLLMFRQDSSSLHLLLLSLPASLAHLRTPISLNFFLFFFPSCASFSQHSLCFSLPLLLSYLSLFQALSIRLSLSNTHTHTDAHTHTYRQTDKDADTLRNTERVLKEI